MNRPPRPPRDLNQMPMEVLTNNQLWRSSAQARWEVLCKSL